VPNTTKTMALLTTSTSSQLPKLHQQARERSTISQRFHDISARSDTLRTLSHPLKSTMVAPTQVYGLRCTASRHAPLEAMKTTWQDTFPF
jgi:hypothetical protein